MSGFCYAFLPNKLLGPWNNPPEVFTYYFCVYYFFWLNNEPANEGGINNGAGYFFYFPLKLNNPPGVYVGLFVSGFFYWLNNPPCWVLLPNNEGAESFGVAYYTGLVIGCTPPNNSDTVGFGT